MNPSLLLVLLDPGVGLSLDEPLLDSLPDGAGFDLLLLLAFYIFNLFKYIIIINYSNDYIINIKSKFWLYNYSISKLIEI